MKICLAQLIICWTLAGASCLIGELQAQQSDRGVTILDSAPKPPPPLPNFTPAPLETSPAQTNSEPGANSDVMTVLPGPPAPDPPNAAAVSPQLPNEQKPPPSSKLGQSGNGQYADQVELSEAIRKLPNPGGLSLQLMPGTDVEVGTRLSIHVLSRKSGYLILVDVDPNGRLTQIFPNPRSLLTSKASPRRANLIEPGKAIVIPDSKNPFTGFELRATPPTGKALLVGLLSNRPVQVLDLPDIPDSMVGQAAALTYLQDMAQRLKVAQLNGALEDIGWSFDAKFYSIR